MVQNYFSIYLLPHWEYEQSIRVHVDSVNGVFTVGGVGDEIEGENISDVLDRWIETIEVTRGKRDNRQQATEQMYEKIEDAVEQIKERHSGDSPEEVIQKRVNNML